MENNYNIELLNVNNKTIITRTEKRIALPFLTKYEKTMIIGLRAQQLANNALPLIDTRGLKSCVEIAAQELKEKKTPIIIRRNFSNNKVEDWKISELIDLEES